MDEWDYKPARDLDLSMRDQLRSVRREGGLASWFWHRAWRSIVVGYMRAWHRLEVVGREHLPAGPPFVITPNHGSHLDAPAVSAALPAYLCDRTLPLAAEDTFFHSTAMSAFAGFMINALPVRRGGGIAQMETFRARLLDDSPCGFILFPEGTRSRDGAMAPFKPGVGILVAGTNVPAVPCRIEGVREAMPPGARIPRPRKIRIRFGPAITFADCAHDKEGWKTCATRLEAAVRELGN